MIKAKKLAFHGNRRKPKGGKVIPPEFVGKVRLDENKEWVKKEIPKRVSYPQDWPSYNLTQTQEKLLFYKILNDAVDFLDIEEKFAYRGRPRVPMRDVVKATVVKVFCGFSLRRTVSELKMIKGLGYINQIPSYNCLADAFQNPELGTHLGHLYQLLALPLKA